MPILAESKDSRNLSVHFEGKVLDFQFQAHERFLYRSVSDFLEFGQFLANLKKDEEGYKTLAETYDSSFVNSSCIFAENFAHFPLFHQQRLINLDCPYWTISCLRKLPKIPPEQFENFLTLVEQQAQQVGRISAKQVEAIARQFLLRRRNYLILGQLVTEEDWLFVAEKLHLSDEQLHQVKQEVELIAQSHLESETPEIKTDYIIEALSVGGIEPDSILSPIVRLRWQYQQTQRQLEVSESEKWQLQQEIDQLQQKLREFESQNLENSQITEPLGTIPSSDSATQKN